MRLGLFGLICALGLAGCEPPDETSGGIYSSYPDGPWSITRGGILPDLTFPGVTEEGALGDIHLHDYHAPRAATPEILLLTVSGGLWCGTCLWHASHDGELSIPPDLGRVRRLDLITGDRDNRPAIPADAAVWQQAFHPTDGAGAPPPDGCSAGSVGTVSADGCRVAVGADPAFTLGAALEGQRAPLPLFLLVDTSSMQVMDVLSNPDGAELALHLTQALAGLAGEPSPEAPEETLLDGTFHQSEWDLLQLTTLPGAPPPDLTNAVSDSPLAASFGEKLFFDKALSPSGEVACATCHDPQKHLADDLPRAQGAGPGDRRTPSIALSSHARSQSWDGRAATLWSQALGPFESPTEFASSRVFIARRIADAYAAEHAAAFPDSPLPDMKGWPESGRPGDPEYEAMSEADRDAATRVFVQAAKAIAAYERTFRVAPNPLDAYLAGDTGALTSDQKYGLQLFVRSGCMQCHWGPRLTDDAFHVTRTPTGRTDGAADPGRLQGFEALLQSDFLSDGRWSDSPSKAPIDLGSSDPTMLGQFKTPPLRGVAHAAFLGHGGAFDRLSGITEAYGHGGVPADDPTSAGVREPWLMSFGETVQWGLVPFLEIETAETSGDF